MKIPLSRIGLSTPKQDEIMFHVCAEFHAVVALMLEAHASMRPSASTLLQASTFPNLQFRTYQNLEYKFHKATSNLAKEQKKTAALSAELETVKEARELMDCQKEKDMEEMLIARNIYSAKLESLNAKLDVLRSCLESVQHVEADLVAQKMKCDKLS